MKKIITIIVSLLVLIIIALLLIYKNGISKVSNNSDIKEFVVEQGSTYVSIASDLKKQNLIKSELIYKIYIKLNKPTGLEAGRYNLSENMDLKTIVSELSKGSNYNTSTIKITFKEGKNMRYIAKIIADNTSNTEEDVFNLLKDKEYIKSLIEKYWFLTDNISSDKIYYPLEGYLFPDTYEFLSKDVNVKDIFKTMLDEMENKLKPLKEDIDNSKYNIHELLTLASIVELEGATSNDRAKVAGVFYNRLSSGWMLGSDVTTYYAEKKDDWNGLTYTELNRCNAYNTRGNCVKGLPIGPICNPGLDSIKAVINPEKTDNYYFVADCSGKTYLNKTESGHNSTIKKLKNENNWCEK